MCGKNLLIEIKITAKKIFQGEKKYTKLFPMGIRVIVSFMGMTFF